jgi:hypothetical protein
MRWMPKPKTEPCGQHVHETFSPRDLNQAAAQTVLAKTALTPYRKRPSMGEAMPESGSTFEKAS